MRINGTVRGVWCSTRTRRGFCPTAHLESLETSSLDHTWSKRLLSVPHHSAWGPDSGVVGLHVWGQPMLNKSKIYNCRPGHFPEPIIITNDLLTHPRPQDNFIRHKIIGNMSNMGEIRTKTAPLFTLYSQNMSHQQLGVSIHLPVFTLLPFDFSTSAVVNRYQDQFSFLCLCARMSRCCVTV